MSVESRLDEAFSTLLQKALRSDREIPVRPASINFYWGGGGTPLTLAAMDPILVEVPFPSRVVWVHIFSGDAFGAQAPVTATFALQTTNAQAFGVYGLLSGTGNAPSIAGAAFQNVSLVGWKVNLNTGDALVAVPVSFANTAATWVAMTIQLRPTEQAIGITDVTDNAGSTMSFSDGTTMTIRT